MALKKWRIGVTADHNGSVHFSLSISGSAIFGTTRAYFCPRRKVVQGFRILPSSAICHLRHFWPMRHLRSGEFQGTSTIVAEYLGLI